MERLPFCSVWGDVELLKMQLSREPIGQSSLRARFKVKVFFIGDRE